MGRVNSNPGARKAFCSLENWPFGLGVPSTRATSTRMGENSWLVRVPPGSWTLGSVLGWRARRTWLIGKEERAAGRKPCLSRTQPRPSQKAASNAYKAFRVPRYGGSRVGWD